VGGRARWLPPVLLTLGVVLFAHEYLDPRLAGVPNGLDLGFDLAYVGPLRRQLLEDGSLLGWHGVAFEGLPLVGYPLSHIFYLPFLLPALALGTFAGVRFAYLLSLLLGAFGMDFLARRLGARPLVAAWSGLLFVMSGALGARLYAGHVERVFGLPLLPWIFAAALLAVRATRPGAMLRWALLAGLLQGLTYLAGDSYLLVILSVTLPLMFLVGTPPGALQPRPGPFTGVRGSVSKIALILAAWAIGVTLATAGKVLAGLDLLGGAERTVDPFLGGQDAYWALAHLIYPFFVYGPVAPGAAPAAERLPGQPFLPLVSGGHIPGPVVAAPLAWWEYTQYVGVLPVALALLAAGVTLVPRYRRLGLLGAVRRREVAALLVPLAVGAAWLANAFAYSPVHWLYLALPPLQQFRVPSRGLMVVAPAVLALAALGLEALLRAAARRGRFRYLPWALALLALADLYLITGWIPRVNAPAADPAFARLVTAARDRDRGPFLVDLEALGLDSYSSPVLELSERDLRIANWLAPLEPRSFHVPRRIPADSRVRYVIAPDGRPPQRPGVWRRVLAEGDLALYQNDRAAGEGWLITDGAPQPLPLSAPRLDRFTVRVTAPAGATLVVPASPFPGWQVAVDGGPPQSATAFEGLVAAPATPGAHTYEFRYATPWLPLVLPLGLLPWAVIAGLLVRAARLRRN
jgi:hypothetical protein